MSKHVEEKHKGVSPGFSMLPIAGFRTVLRRYTGEGIIIEKQQDNTRVELCSQSLLSFTLDTLTPILHSSTNDHREMKSGRISYKKRNLSDLIL